MKPNFATKLGKQRGAQAARRIASGPVTHSTRRSPRTQRRALRAA